MRRVAFISLCFVFLLSGCSSSVKQISAPASPSLSSVSESTTDPAAAVSEVPALTDSSDSPAQNAGQKYVAPQYPVYFKRVSRDLKDVNGKLLATTYFDKPVLIGDSDAFTKINTYFENECQAYFYGSANSMNFKEDQYSHFIGRANEESVRNMSYYTWYCTLDTEVTYISAEIVSFKETFNWYAGGVHNLGYYGATFDLKTGELLTIDHFVDVDINGFNQRVICLLNNQIGTNCLHNLENKYQNYKFADYNFYFDGKDLYLISEDLRNDFDFKYVQD